MKRSFRRQNYATKHDPQRSSQQIKTKEHQLKSKAVQLHVGGGHPDLVEDSHAHPEYTYQVSTHSPPI